MTMNQSSQAAPGKPVQLPPSRRLYIEGADVQEATVAKLVLYTGPRGGTYVDANADWHHKHKNENPSTSITYDGRRIKNMHPAPNHGPNIAEFTNGEQRPQNDPPLDKDGKEL